jgi:TPR repeat protein
MRKLISALAFAAALSLPGVASAAGELAAAEAALKRGDYATVVQLLQVAGEAGNTIAAETLGDMLWYGESIYGPDVHRDPAAATEWFRRAARQGSAYARYMLAEIDQEASQARTTSTVVAAQPTR